MIYLNLVVRVSIIEWTRTRLPNSWTMNHSYKIVSEAFISSKSQQLRNKEWNVLTDLTPTFHADAQLLGPHID